MGRRCTRWHVCVHSGSRHAEGQGPQGRRRTEERPLSVGSRGTESVRLFRAGVVLVQAERQDRSEEHTSELQSLMRISYAVFCLKKKKKTINKTNLTRNYKHEENL